MRAFHKWSRHLLVVSLLGACLTLGAGVVLAQGDDRDDPESGATFARVRYLDGRMTIQRSEDGQLVDSTLNDPVVAGDRLTMEDGRSEIGLADGSTLWLDQGTRLSVGSLADIDNRYEATNLFVLESGAVRVEAADLDSKTRTFRFDTEAGSVYILSGGSFRVEADEGVTTLYSFRGVAELSGDDGSVLVRSGSRSSVLSGRAPSEPLRFNTARLDDFDRFCEDRLSAYVDRTQDQPVADIADEVPDEVHPYMNELSYYGSWHQVPDYGWVWRPVYANSWGPYVNGYWSWCRTGWVWVSYDPWGWAPYHYGRWDFAVNRGWIWIPGRVWSGAWVSFAVGSSHVGWCPLNYYNRPVFQDINIVNVVNVNVGRLQPRGWRFVPVGQFSDPIAPRTALRADRLPRGTDVVLTSRLPRFDPRDVGSRPERGARFVETVRQARAPLPENVGRDNKPQSFRTFEKSLAPPRGRLGAPSSRDQNRPPVTRGRSQVAPRDESARPGQEGRSPRRTGAPYGQLREPAPNGQRSQPPARDPLTPRGRQTPPELRREPQRAQPRDQGGQYEAPRPGNPRGRESSPGFQPQRSQPRDPRNQGGRYEAPRPGAPRGQMAPEAQRPRREPGDQRRETPPNGGRPGADSDQAIGRLFNGVRGERGRPRVDPPQAARPSREAPPEANPRQRQDNPQQGRPPAERPRPKPRDHDDNGKGH